MRNAASLLVGSLVLAVAIAAGWFWIGAPPAAATAPQTVAAKQPDQLPPAVAKAAAARPDVETTAAIPEKPAGAPQPTTHCANPDALGVSRVVVIDTTGGPGF